MRQLIKNCLWFGLLALGLQTSWAFSLLGPDAQWTGTPLPAYFGDKWQITDIGYNPLTFGAAPPFFLEGLQTGPKNLGEEYRRNTVVMYYAADATFLDYFGSNGIVAVDQAFGILNGALNGQTNAVLYLHSPTNGVFMGPTNGIFNGPAWPLTNNTNLGVDNYTAGLSDFPLNSVNVNYEAQSLYLLDLESETLSLMMEQLGLADSVRYTWALHQRGQPTGASCPSGGPGVGMEYAVIQRNFDVTASPLNQIQYSAYVNGEFYSYYVYENCGLNEASPPDADAIEVPVDPLFNNPPVASGFGEDGLLLGEFYTGLTRDDVAGLRYLLTTNNANWEAPSPGSLLISSSSGGTNYGPPYVLYTSNYTAFVSSALTNDPATLSNLFPGLIIASSSNYPVVIHTPNVVTYYTNNLVLGNPPSLVTVTNGYTDTVMLYYVYNFANVVIITNSFYNTNSKATLVTVKVTPNLVLGNPPVTNVTTQTITLTNMPSGDYFILTNSCGVNILYQLPYTNNVTATTNVIATATNLAGYFYSQSIVTYATNHAYWVQPIICSGASTTGVTNGPGLYQGIEKIQFIRANYDSLLGQFFQPITTTYSMVMWTNSQLRMQTYQRVVTTPDFLLSAADLATGGNAANPWANPYFYRSINFDTSTIYTNLSGPGVINPSTRITYNKVGPVYFNYRPILCDRAELVQPL